jgi:hypothetical protein
MLCALMCLWLWRIADAQQSLDFSRVSKLVFNSRLTTATVTVESWVKFTSLSNIQGILLFNDWLSNETGTAFHLMFSDGVPRLSVHGIVRQGSTSGCCANYPNNPNYKSNTWMHVAFTANADTGATAVFINGTEVSSRTVVFNSNLNTRKFLVCPCTIGNYVDADRRLAGLIGPVRLWRSVRTAAQIQASMAGAPASGDDAVFAFDDYSMVKSASDNDVSNSVGGGGSAVATVTGSSPTSAEWPPLLTTTTTTTTRTVAPTPAPTTTTTTQSTTASSTSAARTSAAPTATTPSTTQSQSTAVPPTATSAAGSGTEMSANPALETAPSTTATFANEATLSIVIASPDVTSMSTSDAIVNVPIVPDGALSTIHIGIIVGVLVLACLLALVTAWYISRRQKNKQEAPTGGGSLRGVSSSSDSTLRSHEYGRFDGVGYGQVVGDISNNAITYGSLSAAQMQGVEYDATFPTTFSTSLN